MHSNFVMRVVPIRVPLFARFELHAVPRPVMFKSVSQISKNINQTNFIPSISEWCPIK